VTRTATLVALPVVLVAALVALVLHDGEPGPGPAQARVSVLDGTVAVTSPAGDDLEVDDVATVDFGDTVTVRSGSATLTFADGSTFELRHRHGTGTAVVVGTPLQVTAGDLLVSGGYPARVQVGAATVSALGALRVDADEDVAVAYEGRATVAGVGDVDELRRLRRLVLVPGASPEPVTFDGTDAWDRRYLGEAIAFGERLEALARGYTSDLPPGAGRTAEFFRSVVPELGAQREFNTDLIDPARGPGETLVGAVIAVHGRQGTFRERWSDVFAFRDAGAAWGLVALDQGVSSAPVLEAVELAIATPGAASPASTTTSTTSTTTTTSAGPVPTAPPAPDDGTTTTTAPAPAPSGGLLDPVVDPVADLLSALLGRPDDGG
jgi:hypothetical protein